MRARIVLACLLAAGCGPRADPETVTIFAASSLREAVTEIAGRWSRETGRPHRIQFEASSTLARQIREGAPADLFLSAAPEWIDALPVLQRRAWLGNRLVCVVPKETGRFELRDARRLAMAGDQVPAGAYAKRALAHLGIEPAEPPIYGSNVRDVLAKVAHGGADAGIVYATDALSDPSVRVAFTFPEESHPRIVYGAALLQERGRPLFAALFEPWAVAVARRSGFEPPVE